MGNRRLGRDVIFNVCHTLIIGFIIVRFVVCWLCTRTSMAAGVIAVAVLMGVKSEDIVSDIGKKRAAYSGSNRCFKMPSNGTNVSIGHEEISGRGLRSSQY